MKFKMLLLVAVVALSGCSTYVHNRFDKDGKPMEATRVSSFFMTGKAGKITSYVKDGTYTRRVGVTDLEGSGDVEMLRAVFEAGVETGKKGVGVP